MTTLHILRTAAVSGSRDGLPWGEVSLAMDWALSPVSRDPVPLFNHVLVGSKQGVDFDAFEWAIKRELPATVCPAKWNTGEVGGRAEGPIRNAFMPKLFTPAPVVWLLFQGGSGTANAESVAQREQIPRFRWLGKKDGWRRVL